MRNKYNARKCILNGEMFDSHKEMRRYQELLLMEKAGAISNLRRQVKYILIPSQRFSKKVVERECSYVADFVYEENGETVVEDAKGYRTEAYKIKRKLMLWYHGIRIKEV